MISVYARIDCGAFSNRVSYYVCQFLKNLLEFQRKGGNGRNPQQEKRESTGLIGIPVKG